MMSRLYPLHMEWLTSIEIGCVNYHQYDNHGVLCRKCGWPLHNNRTLHWHDDATNQRLKDTTFPIPTICDMSNCGEKHRCELCSEPMKWHYMEFDEIDQILGKMFSLRDEEGIGSVQAGDGVMWMECSSRHPHGPPPGPGQTAQKFYDAALALMNQDEYDALEAEECIQKAIDVYARIGLTIGAIELSMKLAMLVLSRGELEYCRHLLEFAAMANEKHRYEDHIAKLSVTHSVLNGYMEAIVCAQLNNKEGYDAAVSQMQLGYKTAQEEGFQDAIGAAEYYFPKAQSYWDEFNPGDQ